MPSTWVFLQGCKYRFAPEIIARFVALEWWNYDRSTQQVPELNIENIEESLDYLEGMRDKGLLALLVPRVYKLAAKPEGLLLDEAAQT